MKTKRNWLFAISVLVLLSLVLTACGGGSVEETGEAVDAGEAASSDEVVTLRYGLWDANQLPAYEQCAADFTAENPNIKINIEQLGWGDYWSGLQTEMTAGSAPDVFTNHLAKYPEFAAKNQLVDIQPYVERDGVDMGMYLEGLADLWGRDGHRYGLPKDWDTIALVYNQDMLDAAGITLEELNEATWNPTDGGTFEEMVAKLTLDANGNNGLSPDFDKSNVVQYGYLPLTYTDSGGAYGQTQWSHFAVSNGWAFNDGLYDTKYYYDDAKFIETIDWMQNLIVDKGFSAPFEEISSLGGNTIFTSGKAALATDGSWMIGVYTGNEDLNVGFARLPIGPEGRRSMFNGLADSIWVGTEHEEEAWQWVKYLASNDCANTVGEYGVVFPAQESAVDLALAAYEARGLDVSAFTEQALEPDGTFLFPVTDNASEITEIMSEVMDSIFLGQVEPADVFSEVNAEVNATFE